MSNASTIRRQVSGTQQLTLAPLTYTAITTTQTPFSLNNNALTLTGGGIIPLSAGVTGLYQGTGQVLHIHATANLTGGTSSSTTLILAMHVVPAASLPFASTVVTTANMVTAGAVLIATGATGTLGSAETAGAYQFDVYVQLDAQGNLQGWSHSQPFGTSTTALVSTTIAPGLVGEADLNFVVSATLGTAGVVVLDELSMSLE